MFGIAVNAFTIRLQHSAAVGALFRKMYIAFRDLDPEMWVLT